MRLVVWVLLVGCGRVGFGPSQDDASVRLDDSPGVSIDASTCATDPFDGLQASWMSNGGTWSVGGGVLRMDTTGQLGDGSVIYTPSGSFVGRSTAVEVVRPAQQPQVWSGIGWHMTGSASHLFVLEGDLRFLSSTGDPVYATYDAVRHRWLRIREAGGMILAETSADGVSWSLHGMVPAPPPAALANAHFDIGVESTLMTVGPDYALFDNFVDCVR